MFDVFSEVFDTYLDAFTLRYLTSVFSPIVGLFKGPSVFIWASTGWTCRRVRKVMEENAINAWGYTEVIEPENRFVMFQVTKADEERCNEIMDQCIPKYALAA